MSPLPHKTRKVLRRYAKTLPRKQYDLAKELDVHYVTLSRWLNGRACSEREKCEDLARRVLVSHPEWGTSDHANTIRFVLDRLPCTPEQARIIATVLESS